VTNRNRGRGGHSRKRRPAPARAAAGNATDATSGKGQPAGGKRGLESKSSLESQRRGKRAGPQHVPGRAGGAYRESQSFGERPKAPWHPLPLSELLIVVGMVGAVIGLGRGISHGVAPLSAGIAAVLIGTVEVTLREHLSGYRSHTILLAMLPVVVFHVAVVLIVAALTQMPKALNVGLLLPDAVLGTLLYKLLRVRYLDARRERKFAGRR
jgi:hypothetical protein